jgi:hypothetical protein|tara:strand:- start:601 stop:1020 length:420 start_codon:yes stop_codon:yes gene_type:complete
LQIVDCRPKLNADVNRARGKGYERPQDYPNTQIAFMGIENIHAMRASLKAFLALMKPRSPHHAFAHGREDREEQGWLGELEKSGSVSHGDDPKPIAAEPNCPRQSALQVDRARARCAASGGDGDAPRAHRPLLCPRPLF